MLLGGIPPQYNIPIILNFHIYIINMNKEKDMILLYIQNTLVNKIILYLAFKVQEKRS